MSTLFLNIIKLLLSASIASSQFQTDLDVFPFDQPECSQLIQNQTSCPTGENKAWTNGINMSFQGYTNLQEISPNEMSCRLKCLSNPTCRTVEFYPSMKKCLLYQDINKTSVHPGKLNFEISLFFLSCCKDVQKQMNQLLIKTNETYSNIQIIKNKYNRCFQHVWLKENMSYYHNYHLQQIQNSTTDDCYRNCSNQLSCIAFEMNQTQCSLIYLLGNQKQISHEVQTFVLHCPDVPVQMSQFCKNENLSNCKNVWKINKRYRKKNKNNFLNATVVKMTELECRRSCSRQPNCTGYVVSKTSNKCELLSDKTKVIAYGYGKATLSCCNLQPDLKFIHSFTQVDKLNFKCLKISNRVDDHCTASVWMNMSHKYPFSNHRQINHYFNIPSIFACQTYCDADVNCLTFQYFITKQECITFYENELESESSQTKVVTYMLYCCDGDRPVVIDTKAFCDKNMFQNKTHGCKSGYSLMWSIENMGDSSFKSKQIRDSHCKMKCSLHPTCMRVEIQNNLQERKCNFTVGNFDKSSDVFQLLCCKINKNVHVLQSKNVIKKTEEGCIMINNKTQNKCRNVAWIKSKFSYQHGEIASFITHSFNECLNKCNQDISCILFQYKRIQKEYICVIKYRVGHSGLLLDSTWISYALHCCNVPIDVHCDVKNSPSEFGCPFHLKISWMLLPNTKVIGNKIKNCQGSNEIEWRNNCTQCETIVMSKDRKICKYHGKVRKTTKNESYDTFILSCCQPPSATPHLNPNSTDILSIKNFTTKSCYALTNRMDFCHEPKWAYWPNQAYDHYEFLMVKVKDNLTCNSLCKMDANCLLFEWHNATNNCIKKYGKFEKPGIVLKDSLARKYQKEIDTYEMICCDKDLPIIRDPDNKLCKQLYEKIEHRICYEDKMLYWKILKTGNYSNSKNSTVDIDLNCRRQCYLDRSCTKGSVSINQCKINKTMEQDDIEQFELMCCSLPDIYTNVSNTTSNKECYYIDNQEMHWCENTSWVVKNDFNSLHRNIIILYNNVTLEECKKSCIKTKNCVSFVFNEKVNNITTCYLKYSMGYEFAEVNSILYKLTCCDDDKSTMTVESNNCAAIKTILKQCIEKSHLIWKLEHDMKITSDPIAIYENLTAIECRRKCYHHYNCSQVNIHNPLSDKCELYSNYKDENVNGIKHETYQFFHLHCCILDYPLIKTNETIKDHNNNIFDFCWMVEDKRRPCNNASWIQFPSYHYYLLQQYSNVSITECQNYCNEQISCLYYQWNNFECNLKYRNSSEINRSKTNESFYLYCCDEDLPVFLANKNPKCYAITTGHHTCKSETYILAWEISFISTSTISSENALFLSKKMNGLECRQKCNRMYSCLVSEWKLEVEGCKLSKNILPSNSLTNLTIAIERSVLSCCVASKFTTRNYLYYSTSQLKRFTNMCEKVTDKNSHCDNLAWITSNEINYLDYDIQIFKASSLSECQQKCYANESCLVSVFNDSLCHLKHSRGQEKSVDKSLQQNFSLSEIRCCDNVSKVRQIINVNNTAIRCTKVIDDKHKCNANENEVLEFKESYSKYNNTIPIINGTCLETVTKCGSVDLPNCYSVYYSLDNDTCEYASSTNLESTNHTNLAGFSLTLSCCNYDEPKLKDFPILKIDVNTNNTLCLPIESRFADQIQFIWLQMVSLRLKNPKVIKTITLASNNVSECKMKCVEMLACHAIELEKEICKLLYKVDINNLEEDQNSTSEFEYLAYCINLVNETAASDDICYPTQSETNCTFKWVKDTNIQCKVDSGNVNKVLNVSEENDCKVLCQVHKCASFYLEFVNENIFNCTLMNKLDIGSCNASNTTTMPRYWLGCCKKVVPTNPQYSLIFECVFPTKTLAAYNGSITETNNHKCMNWDDVKPNLFPKSANVTNYCRNINNDTLGPWCLISGSYLFQYCTVPICHWTEATSEENKDICKYKNFHTDYLSCQTPFQWKWVEDKPFECGFGNIVATSVKSTVECKLKCVNKHCKSFVIDDEQSNGTDVKCYLNVPFDSCKEKLQKNAKSRFWIGCCTKLAFDKPRTFVQFNCFFQHKPKLAYYMGNVSETINKRNCLKWDQFKKDSLDKFFNETKETNDHSMCRNVNNDVNGPWCFVNGKFMIEHCNVPKCEWIKLKNTEDDICHVPYEKNTCEKESELKWVMDKELYCNETNTSNFVNVRTDEECKVHCLKISCLSFLIEKLTNGTFTCTLLNKIHKKNCVSSTNKPDRYWLGCCKHLAFKQMRKNTPMTCVFKMKNLAPYIGDVSVSQSGSKCLKWFDTRPVIYSEIFPDEDNKHSFCRNINGDSEGPWCFISGFYMYDYCKTVDCNSTLFIIGEGNGCIDTNVEKTCDELRQLHLIENKVTTKECPFRDDFSIHVHSAEQCHMICYATKMCQHFFYYDRSKTCVLTSNSIECDEFTPKHKGVFQCCLTDELQCEISSEYKVMIAIGYLIGFITFMPYLYMRFVMDRNNDLEEGDSDCYEGSYSEEEEEKK